MTYFAFDIETLEWFRSKEHKDLYLKNAQHKGLTDPAKVSADKAKKLNMAALNPTTGQVIAIGYKTDETECYACVQNDAMKDHVGEFIMFDSEEALIKNFWLELDNAVDCGARIVSFCGKSFDLPFLLTRSLIYNLPPTRVPYDNLIHQYRHDYHIDLKSFLEKGTLNELIYVLNLGKVDEITGAEIARLWTESPYDVLDKCRKDISKTLQIYERIKLWVPPKAIMY